MPTDRYLKLQIELLAARDFRGVTYKERVRDFTELCCAVARKQREADKESVTCGLSIQYAETEWPLVVEDPQ